MDRENLDYVAIYRDGMSRPCGVLTRVVADLVLDDLQVGFGRRYIFESVSYEKYLDIKRDLREHPLGELFTDRLD